MPTTAGHDVADLALAGAGEARVGWAEGQMPLLRAIRDRFARERPLDGLRVAACLHVTAETANLVRALTAGGAQVALCAANPLSTQDDTAAALVEHDGVSVFARRDEDRSEYERHIAAVCDSRPQIVLDDGADLISALHSTHAGLADGVTGAMEETTTGVIGLRALAAAGKLRFPVLAVNESDTQDLFDGRYGTGQSTLDGILRTTHVLLAGRRLVVLGYGRCGRGVAIRAQGAGAHVIVCEVDPRRALEAVMDGYEVMPAAEAASRGDIFVTVTGVPGVLGREHFEAMRDGAIVANSGHFDVEIDKAALEELTVERHEPRPLVEQHVLADGRRINLLAEGRLVNLSAAEGHPAAVMDVCFANQALAAEHIARHGAALEREIQPLPEPIDREVAALKLESLGVAIDELSGPQREYLQGWQTRR
ncbi:MAG: adenosylhomocysteinase [Thermoleophilaceae bacterium]|nr:adenosylhomocysteinase [Thermoleophilaceae bacterium]